LAKAQKTLPHGGEAEVRAFLDHLPANNRRDDALKLTDIMRRVTGQKPVMWGTSIVGFGSWTYSYASGGEGIAPKLGFSPRANRLVLYLPLWQPDLRAQLAGLGPHEANVSCLYLKSLDDVDPHRLEKLLAASFKSDAPSQGRIRSDRKSSSARGKAASKGTKAAASKKVKRAAGKSAARKPAKKARPKR
jgi:hypothetical protein